MAQHYPLYRVSDAGCTGLDAAPAEDRHLLFREKYDVLSKEASQRVRAFQSDHRRAGRNILHKQKVMMRLKSDDLTEQQTDCGLASHQLLWWFKPRLILSGHTHSGCEVLHDNKYPEISVPSFNWRNRNNPSFIMVRVF